jgi:hypothetical protein
VALTNAYCSVADVREHMGDSGSALNTNLLERAINASSRAIDRYTQRRFWRDAAVTTRTYFPDDPMCVYVDDISTTTGLVVATGTDGATFGTTWATTDYALEPRNAGVVASGDTADAYAYWRIVSIAGRSFPMVGYRPTLQVTARFGWSAVPPDVTEACILKAVSLFKRKDAPFGVAGFDSFGAVRVGGNDPAVVDLLSPFRNPVVG